MISQRMRKAVMDNPKKLANLIDLVNLPSTLREFMGQSQSSRLGCFRRVWLHIKENNLQDPNNKNVFNCDEKLKHICWVSPRSNLLSFPCLSSFTFRRSQNDHCQFIKPFDIEDVYAWLLLVSKTYQLFGGQNVLFTELN